MPSPSLWRHVLRNNFTDWRALAKYLQLDDTQLQQLSHDRRFATNVPMRLASKMAKGSLDDPITRQFLPHVQEEIQFPGYSCNPVGDEESRLAPRLLHKYHGRALLLTTSACAMHCRFCFRQHFDYANGGDRSFAKELEIIRAESSLREIILSGGDPLSLDDRELGFLLRELDSIPHVKHLRFHSRFPIGIPERIDDAFLEILTSTSLQLWFVLHVNHPHELDDDVLTAMERLRGIGVQILSQTVLLQGVNDDVDTLEALCLRLVDHGIVPYYMHQLDRTEGTAHFEVDEKCGGELVRELEARLPGYAIPRYVREVAGQASKSAVMVTSEYSLLN